MFDIQSALWTSGVDQAVLTDGGTSVALAIAGDVRVKGGRHHGNADSFNTVTNYLAFTPVPVAKITIPATGSILKSGIPTTVSAAAKGGANSITKVEFYQGSSKIGEANTSPYSITFTPTTTGSSTLSAKVTDADGETGRSIELPITVNP